MHAFNSNPNESRHLRDTNTILQENIPKKRRRLDIEKSGNNDPDNEALYGSESGVDRNLKQEERKACLKELLPIIIGRPLIPTGRVKKMKDSCATAKSGGDDKADEGGIEVDEEEGKDAKKAVTTQQLKSKGIVKVDPLMCYKKRLEELKQDNEMLLQRRHHAFQSYASLISKYEYGLKHISNLGSLAESPDNVMDGNFTKKDYTS
jgi:hypothetical protein